MIGWVDAAVSGKVYSFNEPFSPPKNTVKVDCMKKFSMEVKNTVVFIGHFC